MFDRSMPGSIYDLLKVVVYFSFERKWEEFTPRAAYEWTSCQNLGSVRYLFPYICFFIILFSIQIFSGILQSCPLRLLFIKYGNQLIVLCPAKSYFDYIFLFANFLCLVCIKSISCMLLLFFFPKINCFYLFSSPKLIRVRKASRHKNKWP